MVLLMRSLLLPFLFLATSLLFAAPVEEAIKYHNLLLKNADNKVLMDRFLEAWLDEQDRASLEDWLETGAKAGAAEGQAADVRVWARYLDHVGSEEKALEQYQVVLQLEPNDGETALAVARLQAASFDFVGALATLGEREDAEAALLRGTYQYRLGNTEAALQLWRGLLEKSPEDRELREDLVRLLRQEGLGKEARELQQELIAMEDDPFQRALDQLELGALQSEGGLKDEALASYRKVLESSGGDSWLEREALHQLKDVFRRERDADGLRVYLSTLREEMPQRMALQKAFARQLVAAGEVEEGAEVFREVLGRMPGDDAQRLEFVELLAFAKKYQEAAEELQVVLKKGAKKELWLRLAELQEDFAKEEIPATLGEIEKLLGEDAGGVMEMARIYARFELDEDALRVLQAGREAYADSRKISEALAVHLVKLEREEEALKIWRGMAKGGGVEDAVRVAQSLQRQQLTEEAFALLGESREELGDTFGGLRLYCELALQEEEYELAWAGVRELIVLPKVFTDLQAAVALGSVIGRKLGVEKSIAELESVEGENALCLLATLQQQAGDWKGADATLAKTEGELGRRHRIVALKQRGDFPKAIERLREMMGEDGSLVLRKELLELLQRQRDFKGALVEAEQWKMLSPGEVQAWKKRASLLVQLGRYAEASEELKRARNRFGKDDVELTRELAKVQLPLGKHREALRLYEHLFRVAATDEERFKFVDEMYAAARQAGVQGELIAGFEKEHEKAKRELFPLRLLARLYGLEGNSGAQQEALLKLHRLLPNDETVLFDLVDLAQKNQDLAGARQLLSEFAARTRSTGLLRRLATIQLRAGEIDSGLEILSRIAPAELTAGDVQETALELWNLKEHQLAFSFLEKQGDVVKTDWLLQAMRADFLKKVGRIEEAKEAWVTLLEAEGVLGRSALIQPYAVIRLPAGGVVGEYDWRQLLAMYPDDASRGLNRLIAPVLLPTSDLEARWLSLAQLATESLREDASGEQWKTFLETLDYPWLAEVREWGLFPKEAVVPAFVEEGAVGRELTPEMQLNMLVNDLDASSEDFLKWVPELEVLTPVLANTCRLYAAFRRPEGAEKLAELREVVFLIAEEEQGGWGNATAFLRLVDPQLSWNFVPSLKERLLEPEKREKLQLLEPWWQKRIKHSLEKDHLTNQDVNEFSLWLGLQRLSGDLDGYFENLNRVMELNKAAHIMLVPGIKSNSRYSRPLYGMPDRVSLLNNIAAQNAVYGWINRVASVQILTPELLAKAKKEGWDLEGSDELEKFAEKIPSVKDGLLRALLFEKIGREEEAFQEMEALNQTGGLEAKLDALSFRYGEAARSGKNEPLIKALLAIDRTEMSPAELGLLDGVTLGEANKCRNIKELGGEEKSELEAMLARFTKGPAGRSKVSRLRSLYSSLGLKVPQQRRQVQGGRQSQSYRRLLTGQDGRNARGPESEEQRKETYFMEQVRRSLSNWSTTESEPNRGLLRLVGDPRNDGFKEKVLANYQPGESRSYQKRVRYAQVCLVYGELEEARKVLETLLSERPYDTKLEVLSLLSLEPEKRTAFLDQVSQTRDVAGVINFLIGWAKLTPEEEAFFDAYERLTDLLKNRTSEFTSGDSRTLFETFRYFENQPRTFQERSLRRMSSVLPRLKEGEDSEEGDWALRERQHKILHAAYGEMLRLRGIRGQVFQQIEVSRDALRLSEENVESIILEALKKEPVKEKDFVDLSAPSSFIGSGSGVRGGNSNLALLAVQDSEDFTKEVIERFVVHEFLSEEQGVFLKAALEGDKEQVEVLLGEFQEKMEAELEGLSRLGLSRHDAFAYGSYRRPIASLNLQLQWVGFLEVLLRSKRWDGEIQEGLENTLLASLGEQEYRQRELSRICQLGSAEEALAALEEAAKEYFPTAAMHESYQELMAAGAVSPEVSEKINAGTSVFTSLQNVPRAWIPLLTFLQESDRAVWLNLNEEDIRAQLKHRLNVMYKRVFYDRLRAEGFSSYDGLALLGEERVTKSGKITTWLETLIVPLKLTSTEGRTYWLKVSEDCREQVEEITYLEAFLAMRKDFKISDEDRQDFLVRVLESELGELSDLSEEQLRAMGNLVRRDFPELKVTGASEALESFLKKLRSVPREGVVEKATRLIVDEKALRVLGEGQAKGLCSSLAGEGTVELAAEFWVALPESEINK